jgi:hypothetical protein
VELDLYMLLHVADLEHDTDEAERHYTNFLTWSDTTLVGIDRAVKSSGDAALIRRWDELGRSPLRELMRRARNSGLKGREGIVGWEYVDEFADGGYVIEQQFQIDTLLPGHSPVLGTSADFLIWIHDEALPILAATIDLGAARQDTRGVSEMPYSTVDPWTTRESLELISLLEGLDRRE